MVSQIGTVGLCCVLTTFLACGCSPNDRGAPQALASPAEKGTVRPSESALRELQGFAARGFFREDDPRWSESDRGTIRVAMREFTLSEAWRRYEILSAFSLEKLAHSTIVTVVSLWLDKSGNALAPTSGCSVWAAEVSSDGKLIRVFRVA
jgi:hypothetical protein